MTRSPLRGAQLVFLGRSPEQTDEGAARSFVPEQLIVLGAGALDLFEPGLPGLTASTSSLGAVTFGIEQPFAQHIAALEDALQGASLGLR